MAKGDHIQVGRLGYSHHGVDCGDGTVIHFSGDDGEKKRPYVRRTSLDEFAQGAHVHVAHHAKDPKASVARAEQYLDADNYSLIFHNCEHFARWCATGRHKSRQVRIAISGLAVGVTGLLTWLVLRRGSRTG